MDTYRGFDLLISPHTVTVYEPRATALSDGADYGSRGEAVMAIDAALSRNLA